MIFEGDSQGVGHLNYAQFAQHVSEFVAKCLEADKKAADIVATAVQGNSSARISQKQLKEQARYHVQQYSPSNCLITIGVGIVL
eukprot:COSAG02_NODE_107_length_36312_cov_45.037942_35_plen_84_part_00